VGAAVLSESLEDARFETHKAWVSWLQFLLRRLLRLVISLFVIVLVAFLAPRAAGGDPVRAALGATAPESVVRAREAQLGLDQSLLVQFGHYLLGLLHGDLGSSFITGASVSAVVRGSLPATVELAGLASLVVLVVGIPLGLVVAIMTQGSRRRILDFQFTSWTGLFASVPSYLFAVALVLVFGLVWKVLPVAGKGSPGSYVLPVLALAVPSIAVIARIGRLEALRVMEEDYVRAARSKRLPGRIIYLRHVLPNMLTSILTLTGMILGGMVSSSVLVEDVFNWPGLGNQLVQAIASQDYGVVQGIALVYAAFILVVNLVVDICVALIDPRNTLMDTG
jgi:peptide/nickel transport system permease protein